MKPINHTISRHSKLGWNYNTDARDYNTIGIPPPDKPYYTGTFRQVIKAIEADRNYYAEVSGGAYMTEAWFAWYKGKWRRIVSDTNQWIFEIHQFKTPVSVQLER